MKNKDYIAQDFVKDEIKSRFVYDKRTGSLTWAKRDSEYFNKNYAGKEVGYVFTRNGYNYLNKAVLLEVFGRRVVLVVSRVCWLCETGNWPEHTIDHINRDTLDNRFSNLRDVPQSVNNKNKTKIYKKRVDNYKRIN
jgi:hypothetical protein